MSTNFSKEGYLLSPVPVIGEMTSPDGTLVLVQERYMMNPVTWAVDAVELRYGPGGADPGKVLWSDDRLYLDPDKMVPHIVWGEAGFVHLAGLVYDPGQFPCDERWLERKACRFSSVVRLEDGVARNELVEVEDEDLLPSQDLVEEFYKAWHEINKSGDASSLDDPLTLEYYLFDYSTRTGKTAFEYCTTRRAEYVKSAEVKVRLSGGEPAPTVPATLSPGGTHYFENQFKIHHDGAVELAAVLVRTYPGGKLLFAVNHYVMHEDFQYPSAWSSDGKLFFFYGTKYQTWSRVDKDKEVLSRPVEVVTVVSLLEMRALGDFYLKGGAPEDVSWDTVGRELYIDGKPMRLRSFMYQREGIYHSSPDRSFALLQGERGLGESGLTEIAPLALCHKGLPVLTMDNYLLQELSNGERGNWNKALTRCYFQAIRYPDGTLPETDNWLTDGKPVIVLLDLVGRRVIKDYPLLADSAVVDWLPGEEDVEILYNGSRVPSNTNVEIGGGAEPTKDPSMFDVDESFINDFRRQQEPCGEAPAILDDGTLSDEELFPEESGEVAEDAEVYKPLSERQRRHNLRTIALCVLVGLAMLVLDVFLVRAGNGSLAGVVTILSVGVVGAILLRLHSTYQHTFPRRFNMERLAFVFLATFCGPAYWGAKGLCGLATLLLGSWLRPGGIHMTVGLVLLVLWTVAQIALTKVQRMTTAKVWSWVLTVVLSLLLGLVIVVVRAG